MEELSDMENTLETSDQQQQQQQQQYLIMENTRLIEQSNASMSPLLAILYCILCYWIVTDDHTPVMYAYAILVSCILLSTWCAYIAYNHYQLDMYSMQNYYIRHKQL